MTRTEKILARMRNNPLDWRIDDLETLGRAHGFHVRKPGGSHVIFEHPMLAEALSVPARRPIKPVYVRRFVALIDALESSDGKKTH